MPEIKGIREIKVFQGYKDILENFWGIPEWREYGVKQMGDWFENFKVVMLDELQPDHHLKGLGYENEATGRVMIGAKWFETVFLTGDGGFYSMLFKLDDFLSITEQDRTLEFIEKWEVTDD